MRDLQNHWRAVKENMDEAIAFVETMRIPLYDKKYLERFNNTFAANTLNVIRQGLHKACVMSVGRLWDSGADALSLRNLLECLQAPGVIEEIASRRRTGQLQLLEQLSAEKELDIEVKALLSVSQARDAERAYVGTFDALDRVKGMAVNPELARLLQVVLNWRNKKISHPVEQTRLERTGVEIDTIKWGDLERTVSSLEEIACACGLLVDDVTYFKGTHDVWKKAAEIFWSSINDPK